MMVESCSSGVDGDIGRRGGEMKYLVIGLENALGERDVLTMRLTPQCLDGPDIDGQGTPPNPISMQALLECLNA